MKSKSGVYTSIILVSICLFTYLAADTKNVPEIIAIPAMMGKLKFMTAKVWGEPRNMSPRGVWFYSEHGVQARQKWVLFCGTRLRFDLSFWSRPVSLPEGKLSCLKAGTCSCWMQIQPELLAVRCCSVPSFVGEAKSLMHLSDALWHRGTLQRCGAPGFAKKIA